MPDEDPKPRKFRLFKNHEVTVSTDIAEEWDKVKSHFQRNKAVYISGGVFLTVGLLAGRNFQLNPGSAPQIVNNIRPEIAPVISPVMNNVVNNTIENVGHMAKVVQRLDDEKIWAKSIDAARQLSKEQGITLDKAKWLISRNANGHIPHVYGMQYRNIATHALG